jgi:predicted nucleotidyltransferase
VRQQAAIERLARRVDANPVFEGALLLGSVASGGADEVSDVDVIVVVAEGRFDDGWAARAQLHGDEALAAFDDLDPAVAEIGGHKWLSRDLVFFDCLLGTPSSGLRLAGPVRVLTGPPDLADRLPRRPPHSRAELESYAEGRRVAGRTGGVEEAYHALKNAVRHGRMT